MKDRNDDFYKALRGRIRNWLTKRGKQYRYADFLMFAPDLFHLISRLALDDRIPVRYKAQLGAAIAYFVSPMDLIPEAVLGPVAHIDDIIISAYVLSRLINAGHGKVAEEHWAGEKNLLEVVRGILDIADQAIGKGLWNRVRDIVDGSGSSHNTQ